MEGHAMTEMEQQLSAFQAMRSQIQRDYGSVWVLVAHRELIQTFPNFSAAAQYALAHHADEQVLIRHTDEEEVESAPFIYVAH
jgi:hypothetical protein